MPPPIPTYDQAYAGLAGIYDPETALVNKQMGEADTTASADLSSLDQAKINAFKGIENNANAKGVLFSGVTPENELTYTGTKYLPAVAGVKTAQTNTKNTLTAQLNKIMADRANQATGQVSAAQKAFNDWQAMQNTNNYRNEQLKLGYARLGVSQQRANAAADKPLTQSQTVGAIHDFLQGQKGGDNHVAPSVLASAYKTFLSAGGSDAAFWTNFQGYWNPKQGNYKAMFNAAKSAK
jgi:hypothetical protein